jgi:hypothetical protein
VAPPTPKQQQRRARFEAVIGLAAPFLDLVLVAGERVSRMVGPPDDYVPIRAPSEGLELGRSGPARAATARREIAD